MTAGTIPIIDMSPFTTNDVSRIQHVVDEVRSACEEIGFFSIVGHGFSDDLITRMYDVSRTFFDQAAEKKLRVAQNGAVLGGLMHFPLLAEHLAASLGQKTPGDVKETLDYGPGFYGDAWPDEPTGLYETWMEYFGAMSDLAGMLQRIFALAIGVDESFFEDKFDRHHSSLRVLHYPEQETEPVPGQLRAGAHSDYGFLTILRTEDAPGGLQAKRRDGAWVDVPHIHGAFVVNIGDALMRWTNDRWVSTVHRVLNPPRAAGGAGQTRRQSMAFFNNPNKDAVIACIDQFHDAEHPPKYAPITYGDYAALKYEQAHGKKLA